MELYLKFAEWLDNLLENNDMPDSTKAFNFNLYDDSQEEIVFGVQLIASDRFDAENQDWACYECWSSEEDIFYISADDEEDKSGQAFQKFISELICDYLEKGTYRDILLDADAVGVGFVDGDIDLLYTVEK